MARSKVKSRSHHDIAHLHHLTNVPTKYQLPTPYSFRDIARTNFFPPPAHLDTMGENNTPTALKGCGVITLVQRWPNVSTSVGPTLAQQLFGWQRGRWPIGKSPVKIFYSIYSISQSDCSMVLCGHC